MKNTMQDFIFGQIFNADSEQAALLAHAIRESIKEYKDNNGENENGFSVDAQYEDGKFIARCTFSEDYNMTVMYYTEGNDEVVASLFNLQNENELCRLAGLMLSEGWVAGYHA